MQAVGFYLRRFFYFLGDVLVLPFRVSRNLWHDARRGRILLMGLPALFVFVLAIGLALLALSLRGGLVRSYSHAVDEAGKRNDSAAAITYTYKLGQLQPTDETIKFDLAQLLIRDESTDSGPENHRRARAMFNALAPDDRAGLPAAHVMRAKRIWTDSSIDLARKLEQVEQQLNLALIGDGRNEDALTILGEIRLLQRDFEGARQIYLELFENNVAFYRKIAETYQAMGRGEEAMVYLREAANRYDELLERDPDNLTYLRRRANAHAMLGEFPEAVAQLQAASDRESDPARRQELTRNLSNVYISWADEFTGVDFKEDAESRQQFLKHLLEAFRLDPENEVAMTWLNNFALGQFPESEQARAAYDPMGDPENAPDSVLQQIGTYELMEGDAATGIQLLEAGLQRNPQNHTIMNNLAYALMDSDLPRALKLVNRAVTLQPAIPNYRDTRGHLYIRLQDPINAVRDLEMAIRLDRETPNVPYNMIDNPKILAALVSCYRELGMLDDATNYQKKLDQLVPQEQ